MKHGGRRKKNSCYVEVVSGFELGENCDTAADKKRKKRTKCLKIKENNAVENSVENVNNSL